MLNLTQWQEIDAFFMAEGKIFQTLTRLAQSLDRAGISYVIVGGMAMAVHGFVRPTEDIDILLTPEGLAAFQQQLVGRGFVAAFPGATRKFRDAQTGVEIEILTSGSFPGDGKPKPVAFPDPVAVAVDYNGIKVIDLTRLIELKLASGISGRGRLRDLADVQDLIRAFTLPVELAESLDASVREHYVELWDDLYA
ncbi:hypothetical protein HJG54_17455 [Leptolyngbya sp. NK1-12]|uniref:Nucleotidyltransferase family protein n=1 Tax=Leptolyngbya sp. NK1-12 TaxID=2547451 RepID=A0AA97AHF3_9CYAN|nr:hypothetical protein HJG54_17455 [Leptolyngbya sp. NK1-12]